MLLSSGKDGTAPAPKIAERHVRLIVATVGLLGLFTGGFIGVILHQTVFGSGSELLAGLVTLACTLGFAYMIVLVLRFLLTPDADHVRPLLLLQAWGAAIVALYFIKALLPVAVLESRAFQAADVLAIWTAGLLAARPPKTSPK